MKSIKLSNTSIPAAILIAAILLLMTACGMPLFMPQASLTHRLLQNMELTSELTVTGFNQFDDDRDQAAFVMSIASLQPEPEWGVHFFREGQGESNPQNVMLIDHGHSKLSDHAGPPFSHQLNWSFLSSRFSDPRPSGIRWMSHWTDAVFNPYAKLEMLGAGILAMRDSSGHNALLAARNDPWNWGFPEVFIARAVPYDNALPEAPNDPDNPYRGFEQIFNAYLWVDPITDFGPSDVSGFDPAPNPAFNAENHYFAYLGIDITKAQLASTKHNIYFVFSYVDGYIYESAFPFTLDVVANSSNLDTVTPIMLSRFKWTEELADDYMALGYYSTSTASSDNTGKSYLSVLYKDTLVYHTLAWARGKNGSPQDHSTAPSFITDADGEKIEGRMLTVLHDGSLLLKDDYTAEWVFYNPASKATTRFPSGGIRFVQEYKSGGKWYMNMAFSSRYNYQENREERDEEDMDGNSSKWDLYSATYQITTDQMYELAGFEP